MAKAVVITVDQLGARYLSPYGNTWNPTPGFDNLAANGMTAEYCFSSSTCLNASMRSLLTGQHAMANEEKPTLMQQLTQEDRSSLLIQEGDSLTTISGWEGFSEVKTIPLSAASEIADSIELTATARFISLVMEELEQGITHDLIWIHHSSLGIIWDAPFAYREQFFSDEDPEIAEIAIPPIGPLADKNDPDEIMQIVHAYSAQVSVLDTCLSFLLEHIQTLVNNLDESILLCVTSPRSQALGHHGGVGYEYSQPATDQIHVPLFLTKIVPEQLTGTRISPSRNRELLQPECVYATLRHWLSGNSPEIISACHRSQLAQLESPGELVSPLGHQFTLSKFANAVLGIQSPAWFSVSNNEGTPRLYVKPDDRWESNEIANLRKDVTREFETLFQSASDLLTRSINLPESLQKQG